MTLAPVLLLLLLPPLLTAAAGVAVALALWVARPIESLARSREAPRQLALSDLLVLFAMLQFAVGTVHYLVMTDVELGFPSDRSTGAYVVDAFVAAFTLLCWWGGASMLSRAGIQRWWHRIILLALVVPVGSVGTVVLAFLLVVTVAFLFAGAFAAAAIIGGVACVLLLCVGVCGSLSRWIAAKYPLHTPANQPDTER